MAILNRLYPIAMVLSLTGCYEDFDPQTDTEPVLCVNSLITAGEPVEVSVSRTWMFTDEDAAVDHRVDDASVAIYANGVMAGAGYIPQEGDHIRIVADSQTFGMAEAEVTVPVSVSSGAVEWAASVTNKWYGRTDESTDLDMQAHVVFDMKANLTISDPPGVANYYQFAYQVFCRFPDGDTFWQPDEQEAILYPGSFRYEAEPIFAEHIGVFESVTGSDADGFTVFTDRQFSGKEYTLHLHFKDMSYDVRSKEYDESLLDWGIELLLSSVSPSYYNWANYRWQSENGMLGDFSDIGLGDPIWGYSNVSTGAGVVAAQSHAVYRINLKEFLKQNIFNK